MQRHDGSRRVADLVERYTSAHFGAHPEDASTLGVPGYGRHLSSPSRDASSSTLAGLRAALTEASDIEAAVASGSVALDVDAALDLDALQRSARFHARRLERDADAECLERAALPNSALQHGALHARSLEDLHALVERARAVPGYLQQQTENLRRGVAEGRAVDEEVGTTFVERILPGAARALEALVGDLSRRLTGMPESPKAAALGHLAEATGKASDAYRAMAQTVREEILPRGRRDVVLGAEEVAFRLRDVMGVETSIEALLVSAEDRLARAHAEIVEQARIAGHSKITRAEDAKDAILALFAQKARTIDGAMAAYRTQLDAATRFSRERAIVHIPDDLSLALEPLPDGIADGSGFTNWPAPLRDPTGRGHALYSPDPNDHPNISSKQLAIHEGIPGHYLQSAVWQRSSLNPVRFLGVADDVAMSVGYFGTMVSVEGWAVHMEDVMVREGFFEAGNERLFSAWCDAVRAMRVILDLELHAFGKSAAEMTSRVARATLLSEGWARQQVLRSKRIPLQSSTYLIGAMEIESLEAMARPQMSLLEFHRALLSFGPVPMSRLRRHWAAARAQSADLVV
jgi:uncharacterized protein (DUF885 family)